MIVSKVVEIGVIKNVKANLINAGNKTTDDQPIPPCTAI